MARYSGRGLHGQTVELIGRRILSGELGPGATLDTASLTEELGVSLTVVREALKVLSAKGLVDARQKRGTFVLSRQDWNLLDSDVLHWQAPVVDDEFLNDLTETRAVLEPACARMAARRRDEDDLRALDVALERMATAGSPDEAAAADVDFHRALFQASHNEVMQRLQVVIGSGLAERDRLVHGSPDVEEPEPIHRAVAEAVRAADPVLAEETMHELVRKSRRDVEKLVAGDDAKGRARE